MTGIEQMKAFAARWNAMQEQLRERRAIATAIRQVRAKSDMRVCSPGKWRVSTCPLTSMVVVERARKREET